MLRSSSRVRNYEKPNLFALRKHLVAYIGRLVLAATSQILAQVVIRLRR